MSALETVVGPFVKPRPPRFWMVVLAAVFALLQLANVTGRDTPDTKNYLSYALSLRGASRHEAAEATIDHACAGRVVEECPGYPVFLVPFITVLGVKWGLWTSSVLITVTGGVLAFLVLRTLRAPTVAALTGQALFYVLPCGTTAMRPMTEGLLLTLTLAALWGCALALEGRTRAATALVGGSLAALFAVKHSQALFLGLCLAGACAVLGIRRGGPRQPLRRLARPLREVGVVSACGVAVTLLAAKVLGHPSESESLQDLLTAHFSRPDRSRPWSDFLDLEVNFWVEWLRRELWQPFFPTALLAGAWGALRQRPAFGVFLVAGALTGVLDQAGHPDINIYGDRLIVLAWVLPVVGLPLLLEQVVRPRVRGLDTVPR